MTLLTSVSFMHRGFISLKVQQVGAPRTCVSWVLVGPRPGEGSSSPGEPGG